MRWPVVTPSYCSERYIDVSIAKMNKTFVQRNSLHILTISLPPRHQIFSQFVHCKRCYSWRVAVIVVNSENVELFHSQEKKSLGERLLSKESFIKPFTNILWFSTEFIPVKVLPCCYSSGTAPTQAANWSNYFVEVCLMELIFPIFPMYVPFWRGCAFKNRKTCQAEILWTLEVPSFETT